MQVYKGRGLYAWMAESDLSTGEMKKVLKYVLDSCLEIEKRLDRSSENRKVPVLDEATTTNDAKG